MRLLTLIGALALCLLAPLLGGCAKGAGSTAGDVAKDPNLPDATIDATRQREEGPTPGPPSRAPEGESNQ